MKALVILSAIAFAMLTGGCGDKSKPAAEGTSTNAANEGSPLTAPVDYLGAVGKAQQTAVKVVDTASIDQAIKLFQVENGRYPKNLDELVEEKFLPRIPAAPSGMKFVYDPATGKVKAVKE